MKVHELIDTLSTIPYDYDVVIKTLNQLCFEPIVINHETKTCSLVDTDHSGFGTFINEIVR
jgi:hypothetical protein